MLISLLFLFDENPKEKWLIFKMFPKVSLHEDPFMPLVTQVELANTAMDPGL